MKKYRNTLFIRSLEVLWKIMAPSQRKSFIGMFFLIVIGTCLEALGLGLIFPVLAILSGDSEVVEKIYRYLNEFLGIKLSLNDLLTWGLGCLLFVFLFRTLFLAFISYLQAKYSFSFRSIIAQNLFEQYLRVPLSHHLQKNSAEFLHTLFSKTGAVTSLNQQVLLILAESLNILVLGFMLIIIEPIGALSVILILILAGWIFVRFTRKYLTEWAYLLERVDTQRLQIVQEGLGGIKDVKLLGREAQFLDRFQLSDQESCRINYLQATLQSLPRLWLEFLAFGAICFFIYTIVFLNESVALILPMLGIFAATAFRVMPSINRVLAGLGNIGFTLPVVEGLAVEYVPNNYLNLKREPSSALNEPIELKESIDFLNVSYKYDDSNLMAVKNLSFRIKVGSCVGFIGQSGSGKTTLINLLLGLCTPTSGDILVGGESIVGSFDTWKELIGFVPQDIYLSDSTLQSNIAFGVSNNELDNYSIARAVKQAHLDEFVSNLPEGLATKVGERGARISGGQKQRIGIARALYKNPPILVFDEATSALDNQTETFVMDAVDSMRSEKTIVIVAHRLSTIANCDYVYQMSGGEIVNHGTPAQLNLKA